MSGFYPAKSEQEVSDFIFENFKNNSPLEIVGNNSKKIDAIRHAVKICENKKKINFKYVCDLDVSSPLRNYEDIKNSLNKFKREKSFNLITATESKKNPYFNQIEIKFHQYLARRGNVSEGRRRKEEEEEEQGSTQKKSNDPTRTR